MFDANNFSQRELVIIELNARGIKNPSEEMVDNAMFEVGIGLTTAEAVTEALLSLTL